MEEREFRKTMILLIVTILTILAFFILRPIVMAVFFGLVLSYIFFPLYAKLYKKTKRPNLSAFIILFGLLIIILLPLIFLIPLISREIISFYLSIRNADTSYYIRQLFPYLFQSPTMAADIDAMTSAFSSNIASLISSTLQKIVLRFPNLLLQSIIVLFTFFFAIRDQEVLKNYFISISPFPKDYQDKFYQKFRQITSSILYGQLVIGVVQGVISGIGFFIFRVPNALLLTFLSMLVGVIPVIGPAVVWVPVGAYLIMTNRIISGIGILIYGLLVINWVDPLIRPHIVSRKAKMNSAIALIGMIGGLYVFGVAGLILGPLILAYLLLVIEFYKEKRFKSILFEEIKEDKPKKT